MMLFVKVFMSSSLGVVKHEMVFQSQSSEECVTDAESFSNSYNVFTLISQPVRRHAQLAPARAAKAGP